ncbi:phytanoyl-CoA dioxygenase family protein [Nocardia sp. NPDC051981]|uniref:phytanoyl-CoA dioxygenase family protein n=1 Tax=Nocardia sp. NPDC051981 TaxID=3155417 RepID=UPI003415DA41
MTLPVFTPYIDSSEWLENSSRLRDFYDEHGYLYLKGVLDKKLVRGVAQQVLAGLKSTGSVPPDATLNNIGLEIYESVDEAVLQSQVDYDGFWNHPQTIEVFEKVFGEPVFVFKSSTIRYYPAQTNPDGPSYITPFHQDGCFLGPNKDFRTIWIPLLPTSPTIGGVAIADGSHKLGLREHLADDRYKQFGHAVSAIPAATLAEYAPLVFSPVEPGDLLIFHAFTCHRSVPNTSPDGDVRISMDTRVQPASTEAGYIARTPWAALVSETLSHLGDATGN